MPEAPDGDWSVYIVRCRDGSLYTGIATDVSRRIDEHRAGAIGAKYLRGRAPLELAGQWQVGNRSLASRVEHRIKCMSRADKESLLVAPTRIDSILERLEAAVES
jgi:putative endonuclease